jgi:SCY1-like protein 2
MLPVLDFSTVKNDIFPPIATTFSKTNSLAIKIRGLEAFVVLCGGSLDKDTEQKDDLSGVIEDKKPARATPTSILDKYTVQEKLVPLLKAIKTKEPGVMMAALNVFRQIGGLVDTEFIAMEVLPVLWAFSLGPLLNLQQFQQFMSLIKSLSTKVEHEQVRKLRELSSRIDSTTPRQSMGGAFGSNETPGVNETTDDFEQLVLGRGGASNTNGNGGWDNWGVDTAAAAKPTSQVTSPRFSWSSNPTQSTNKAASAVSMSSAFSSTGHTSRSITPDSSISAFPSLEASRPTPSMGMGTTFPTLQPSAPSTSSWSQPQPQAANRPPLSQWGSASSSGGLTGPTPSTFGQAAQPAPNYSAFSIPPPPASSVSQPPQQWQQQPVQSNIWASAAPSSSQSQTQPAGQQKQGLDKYASLL